MHESIALRIEIRFGFEVGAILTIMSDGGLGTEVEIDIDNTVRSNFMLGAALLAVHALTTHYESSGMLAGHWRDFEPVVMDTLELNEMAIKHELSQDGYDVDRE